jgi:RNA polymerase sigma-70 factor (ECF subfamily)
LNQSANLSDLWAMASADDHHAYNLIHKNLYPGLYNYLFQMVKDDDVADDLLQDLFVKIWDKRKQIGVINNLKAYFFTAARSMAINYFRKVKLQASKLENFIQPEIAFSAEDILISGEDDMGLKERMTLALNTLPARQREIIYLKYYQEMEYQKIAEITGIQYQSVVNHVFRALQTLRAEFQLQDRKELVF